MEKLLKGNNPGRRATPQTRLQNGFIGHHCATGVVAGIPNFHRPRTDLVHVDFRGAGLREWDDGFWAAIIGKHLLGVTGGDGFWKIAYGAPCS